MDVRMEHTDVLIIGGGAAGLRAALEASIAGSKVTVLVKGPVNSTWLLGFNAPVAAKSGDSPERFLEDVLLGGQFLNDPELATILATEAGPEVRRLEQLGLDFRQPDGGYKVRLAAGSRYPRTLYYRDETGPRIMSFLREQATLRGVDIRERHTAVKLLSVGQRVVGALGLDESRMQLVGFVAPVTVLATGGAGKLYSFTTNVDRLTGDGYALAYEVGADLMDMEFTQFEPFIMVGPGKSRGFGVPTTLVGDGARIFNGNGDEFLPKDASGRIKSLTKDFFARALYAEIKAGRGTRRGGVFFDVALLPEEILSGYPRLLKMCSSVGIDLSRQPLEVAPAYHHLMGGIRIDSKCRTTVDGLLAAGEAAAGVHGANRLAGNAGTEALVFGAIAGRTAAVLAADQRVVVEPDVGSVVADIVDPLRGCGVADLDQALVPSLARLMWENVGIERNRADLAEAVATISALVGEYRSIRARDMDSLAAITEARSLLTTALLIASSALLREESRGDHWRSDYPHRDDRRWLRSIVARRRGEEVGFHSLEMRRTVGAELKLADATGVKASGISA